MGSTEETTTPQHHRHHHHRSSLLDISGYNTLSSSLQSRASVLLLEDAFPSCEDISFPAFQVEYN
jgi:hypothetical protein